jgi:FG-GAP-like repeat
MRCVSTRGMGSWSVVLMVAMTCGRSFAGGVVIPTFTDETTTRLIALANVGANDPSEKDYGIGDFDGDGDDDIIVARRNGFNGNNGSPLPNVLLLNENGVLTDRTNVFALGLLTSNRSRDVVIADFDNNGFPDAMVANGPATAPVLLMNRGLDNGNWLGFDTRPGMLPNGFNVDAWTVSAGDIANDDDDFPDVFVGVRSGTDRILINRGSLAGEWQGFADESSRLGGNANTSAVRSSAVVDINQDGDDDIIEDVTNPTAVLRIVSNNGSGMFTSAPQTVISGAAYNFGLGDLNGNGTLDFYGVRNGVDQYRENLGPTAGDLIALGPLFSAAGSNGFGAICRTGDLNTDGTDDFLVADLDQEFPQDCSRRLKIYLNSGVAPYLTNAYPTPQPWTPNGTSDVALIDIDGDGDLDMFIGSCSGNAVFMQDGSPALSGDVDGDGDVDLIDTISFDECANGPNVSPSPLPPPTVAECLDAFDFDGDGDVDFEDFGLFQLAFTG